jgi:hypothetical protein
VYVYCSVTSLSVWWLMGGCEEERKGKGRKAAST